MILLYQNLEAHIFHYPWGRKTKWSGGCVYVKNGNPLPAAVSQPKFTPTLSASSHMPEKRLLTRTYSVRDQVPDCPDFTCVKNNLLFLGININAVSHNQILVCLAERKMKFL